MSDSKEQALPFFARYLEGQFCEDLSEEEMDAVQGGRRNIKRPRHNTPDDEIVTTLKYPSDHEESAQPVPAPEVATKKYPSDNEEYAVTMKYPSDGDDDIKA